MKYTVIIEEGVSSYSAYVPDLPGCIAAADTREDTLDLIQEAIVLHLELMVEHGEQVPEPTLDGSTGGSLGRTFQACPWEDKSPDVPKKAGQPRLIGAAPPPS